MGGPRNLCMVADDNWNFLFFWAFFFLDLVVLLKKEEIIFLSLCLFALLLSPLKCRELYSRPIEDEILWENGRIHGNLMNWLIYIFFISIILRQKMVLNAPCLADFSWRFPVNILPFEWNFAKFGDIHGLYLNISPFSLLLTLFLASNSFKAARFLEFWPKVLIFFSFDFVWRRWCLGLILAPFLSKESFRKAEELMIFGYKDPF